MRIEHLSGADALLVLEIIHNSLACKTQEQLRLVMSRLGELLQYDAAVTAVTKLGAGGGGWETEVVNLNYPPNYLAELAHLDLLMKDPILCENFRTFSMQYWADTLARRPWSKASLAIVSLAEDFGFSKTREGCGYSHGVRNLRGTVGSFFCFQGMGRCRRTEEILHLVIPHFHESLMRVERRGPKGAHGSTLTSKETEVMKWIKEGKTTWDISAILGISERTVKFHVGNIKQKLDAVSRSHAVAKAMDQGLL